MRERLSSELKNALKAGDKLKTSTLRLVLAAIHDRDIAHRGDGKEPVTDEDILAILSKMVRQREESAKAFQDGGRPEMAKLELGEIEIIRAFQPKQFSEEEMREICAALVTELEASGLRDMGRVIAALKERYPGAMDFSKASLIVKSLLQG